MQLLKEGEEVTLMDWGNAIVHTISKSPDGKTITGEESLCKQSLVHCLLVLHLVLAYCITCNDACYH